MDTVRPIVKGNDNALAPRPTRRSLIRALYDAVEALGTDGGGTISAILGMLPVTDDAEKAYDNKRIFHNLQQGVHSGYFTHNSVGDYFRIAPLSYYELRQTTLADRKQWLEDHPDERGATGYGRETFPLPLDENPQGRSHHDWRFTLAVGVVAFIAGWAIAAIEISINLR